MSQIKQRNFTISVQFPLARWYRREHCMNTKTTSSFKINSTPGRLRQVCLVLALSIALGGLAAPAQAVDQLTSGTSSRKIRQQAVQAIPLSELTPEARSKITPIIEKPSIYRRLPVTSIDVDPDYFLYLVRYPEVIVNIWQLMGITEMTLDRTGPFAMKSNDGAGAISDVELVYGTSNLNIYHAKGSYSGPLFRRKLHGSCVLVLRTNYREGPNGAPQAVSSLDVFLKVENATASLIAKTVNPIVGSSADHNFVESLNFVQRLNETTEKNGYGVQRMADRLENLTPEVRKGFVKAAGATYQRSTQRKRKSANATDSTLQTPAARVGYESKVQGYSQPRVAPIKTNQPIYPPARSGQPGIQQPGVQRYDRINQASHPETSAGRRSQQVQPALHYQSQPSRSYMANPVFYEDTNSRTQQAAPRFVQPPVYQRQYYPQPR